MPTIRQLLVLGSTLLAVFVGTACSSGDAPTENDTDVGQLRQAVIIEGLQVHVRDESPSDAIHVRPRLFVRNTSSVALSNFKVHYFFSAEAGKQPVLEDYYTPMSSVSLEHLGGTLYRVIYDYQGRTLAAGQTLPDIAGNVVGLHYADWSAWTRDDDWSYAGVTSQFSINDRVVLVDSSGGIVKGSPPPEAVALYEFVTHTLTVKTPKETDPRNFLAVADGSLKYWDGVRARGRAANVGNAFTWLSPNAESGTIFSRPSLTIRQGVDVYGDVFKGGAATISSTANITGDVNNFAFDPKSSYTLSVLAGRESAGPVSVAAGQTRSLVPGRYGDLKLLSNASVELQPGAYWFDSVSGFPASASMALDDATGPIRVFVGQPFDVLGSITHTSEQPGANWLLGVLGSGTVKVNGAFAGTLWAPGSTVQVNKASSPLVGAVYAANVTVMNDAQLHFERPAALACLPKQVRIPRAATCSTNSLSVTSHAGVTRAIWEGIESAADGKRVNPHESFTFAFSAPVTLADLAGAVSLVSVDCPAAGPQDCGHEVELTFEYADPSRGAVRISNPADAFHPGCEYELRIAGNVIGDGQSCLAEDAVLRFFSLSGDASNALGYESERKRRAPKMRGLTSVEFRPEISWRPEELLRLRSAELSLRMGIDTLVPRGDAFAFPDADVETYEQRYHGVPVLGHGYRLHQDSGTGRVQKLVGATVQGLTLSVTPSLAESAARSLAQGAFPDGQPLPQGELVVWSPSGTREPSAFKLAWKFVGTGDGDSAGRVLVVDAQTGALLVSQSTLRNACPPGAASLDLSTLTYVGPYTLGLPNLQSDLYGTPDDLTVSEYQDQLGNSYFPLHRRASDVPGVPVSLFAQCPGESFPRVSQYRGPLLADPFTATLSQVQLAADFVFQELTVFPQRNGDPWIGWDGTGTLPLDIRATPVARSDLAALHLPQGGSHIQVDTAEYLGGAAMDLAGHEISHLVWGSVHSYEAAWETLSIAEGWASLIGSITEYSQRKEVVPEEAEFHLWCFGADAYVNTPEWCRERFDDPTLLDAPKTYQGQHWLQQPSVAQCTGCDLDCPKDPTCSEPDDALCPRDPACLTRCALCDEHTNAGVLEYWFYLLTRGGVSEDHCGASVSPLDSDFETALEQAAFILWETMLREIPAQVDYESFVEGSITATRRLFAGDLDKEETVRSAWQAVGLHDNLPDDSSVFPARGATDANPWGNIVWEAFDDFGSDIQVDTSPDFDSNGGAPLVDDFVSELDSENGYSRYVAALEPNTRYYWRVRPASEAGQPWQACYSVNWFTTGELPKVERAVPDGSQELEPGPQRLSIVAPEGPVEFYIRVSSMGPGCAAAGDVFDGVRPAPTQRWETTSVGFDVPALEPYEHYWLNVTPIGPGSESPIGECTSFELPVGGLPEPKVTSPSSGEQYSYSLPHESGDQELVLKWQARGASSFQIQFFERTETGDCEAAPKETVIVDAAQHCDGVGLMTCQFEDYPFQFTNGTGYCWRVVSKSADGAFESEPSELNQFGFFLPYVLPVEPGASLAAVDTRAQTGAIVDPPGALEDDDVLRFSWEPQAGIELYGFRLARWPWPLQTQDTSPTPVPDNCVGSSSCTRVPNDGFLVEELVLGTEINVDAAIAGEGRYCWDIWPILHNGNSVGEPAPRQPSAYTYTSCYTTGPSEPRVAILEDSPGSGSRQPIEVEFQIDYVPDAQLSLFSSHGDATTVDYSGCPGASEPVRFDDYYDCRIKLRVAEPEEGEDYDFWVRVSNDPAYSPEPGADPDHEVYLVHLDDPIAIGRCGDPGEACCEDTGCDCEDSDCNEDEVSCEDGVCVDCGGAWQACCPGDDCRLEFYECNAGTCQQCGSAGQDCCAGDVCRDNETFPLTCNQTSGQCEQCGFEGGPCCPDDSCVHGNCRLATNTCGACGSPGELCCDGACDDGAACRSDGLCPDQGSGAIPCGTPVTYDTEGMALLTYQINLGSTSGLSVLSFNTLTEADRVLVYYGNDPAPVIDSGCISTLAQCNGPCSSTIQHLGGPTIATVVVEPNCDGTPYSGGQFQLSCPN